MVDRVCQPDGGVACARPPLPSVARRKAIAALFGSHGPGAGRRAEPLQPLRPMRQAALGEPAPRAEETVFGALKKRFACNVEGGREREADDEVGVRVWGEASGEWPSDSSGWGSEGNRGREAARARATRGRQWRQRQRRWNRAACGEGGAVTAASEGNIDDGAPYRLPAAACVSAPPPTSPPAVWPISRMPRSSCALASSVPSAAIRALRVARAAASTSFARASAASASLRSRSASRFASASRRCASLSAASFSRASCPATMVATRRPITQETVIIPEASFQGRHSRGVGDA